MKRRRSAAAENLNFSALEAAEQPEAGAFFATPPIAATSFSRLQVFEECPYRAYLQFVTGVKEPQPPAGVETAGNRGIRIHKEAENYVRGTGPLTPELELYHEPLYDLHLQYRQDPARVSLEQMWCFNTSWEPVGQFDTANIWLRIKQDAVVELDDTRVLLIDYKSGKKTGNEKKHREQLEIAALGGAHRYPKAEVFIIENWYVDIDDDEPIPRDDLPREKVMKLKPHYEARFQAMTNCTEFRPRPSTHACRWCPCRSGPIDRYRNGTGTCKYSAFTP